MRTQRPTSVLVIAIFHFTFGGLGVLLGLIGIAGSVILYANAAVPPPAPAAVAGQPAFSPTAQYQYLDAHLPYWKAVDIVFGVASIAISIFMIVAGVGLVQMRPWGRTLSLVYGVASLIFQLARIAYSAVFLIPAMTAFYDTVQLPAAGAGPAPPFGAIMKAMLIVGVVVSLLGLIYPVIVLIIMSRPKVRAAFRGETMDDDRTDDFDNDPTDRRGRREDEYDDEPQDRGDPDDRFGTAR